MKGLAGSLFAVALLSACSGERPIAPGEPFRVKYEDALGIKHDAQFFEGALPQGPAGRDAGPGNLSDGGPADLSVQYLGGVSVYFQGSADLPAEVRSGVDTHSVGLRLADVGSGYWVAPVGPTDPTTNLFGTKVSLDLAPTIESRYHDLLVVAFDGAGNPGRQIKQPICVASSVPDAYNSCQQTKGMPKAVISLTWDTNADLDLQVHTPEDLWVDSKNPFVFKPDGATPPAGTPAIDRDSNGSCRIDGMRRENLVWPSSSNGPDPGPPGYGLYVNMFSACGQAAARFRLEVYRATGDADGGHHLELLYAQAGELLDISANGGSARGLYVTTFPFQ